ncbi:hypothetical protein O181_083693 [Austropuccinia psidii MF-1]|uniref:Uncharacterized protein n=1 Tax=Austropuccinia psidii MF-1 TaxID=1389203 RepID=A0A9Q3FPV0_9BASI|nr:hypothetical protein [Austropuccinia psidii MF-1]
MYIKGLGPYSIMAPLKVLNMCPPLEWAQSDRVDLLFNSGKAPLFYGPGMALAFQAIWPNFPPFHLLKIGLWGLQFPPRTANHGIQTAALGWLAKKNQYLPKGPEIAKMKEFLILSRNSMAWQEPKGTKMTLISHLGPRKSIYIGTRPLLNIHID